MKKIKSWILNHQFLTITFIKELTVIFGYLAGLFLYQIINDMTLTTNQLMISFIGWHFVYWLWFDKI